MSSIREKLEKLVIGKSDWLDKAIFRKKNRAWIRMSQKVALEVLTTMREKNISKESLSETSKIPLDELNLILKGSENLTLKTISELEAALDIEIIKI